MEKKLESPTGYNYDDISRVHITLKGANNGLDKQVCKRRPIAITALGLV